MLDREPKRDLTAIQSMSRNEDKERLSKEMQKHVEDFVKNGGEIKQISTGVSGIKEKPLRQTRAQRKNEQLKPKDIQETDQS